MLPARLTLAMITQVQKLDKFTGKISDSSISMTLAAKSGQQVPAADLKGTDVPAASVIAN
jgi:hypothetical protein